MVDGTNTYYIKTTDNLISGGFNYVKIATYQDITLLNQVNTNYYTGPNSEDYIKIILDNGEDFKNTFDLTDTGFFTSYDAQQPNKIVLGINTSNAVNALLYTLN